MMHSLAAAGGGGGVASGPGRFFARGSSVRYRIYGFSSPKNGLGPARAGTHSAAARRRRRSLWVSLGPAKAVFCGGKKTTWYNLFDLLSPEKWRHRISPDSTRILNRILPVTRLHIHVFYPYTLVYTCNSNLVPNTSAV